MRVHAFRFPGRYLKSDAFDWAQALSRKVLVAAAGVFPISAGTVGTAAQASASPATHHRAKGYSTPRASG